MQFDSREDAEKAMTKLRGMEHDGNPLKLDIEVEAKTLSAKTYMTPATKPDAVKSSIFIGNLDFAVTDQSIMDMCEALLGPRIAIRVRVATDRDTGMHSLPDSVMRLSNVLCDKSACP